jgi:hypothetical protein
MDTAKQNLGTIQLPIVYIYFIPSTVLLFYLTKWKAKVTICHRSKRKKKYGSTDLKYGQRADTNGYKIKYF